MEHSNQLPAAEPETEPEYADVYHDDADTEWARVLSQMSVIEKGRYARQETVLRYVAETGDRVAGCFVARVTVRTHNRWIETDVLGYRGLLREAEKLHACHL